MKQALDQPNTVWRLQTGMRPGACTSIEVGADDLVRVLRGSALLSLPGSRAEWTVHAGEDFEAPHAGRLVVEAIGQTDGLSYGVRTSHGSVQRFVARLAQAQVAIVDGLRASIRKLQLG